MTREQCSILVAGCREQGDPAVVDALGAEGRTGHFVTGLRSTLQALEERAADVLIVDSREPAETRELLAETQRIWPGLPILVVLDSASPRDIAALATSGASDLLVRPLNSAQLTFSIEKALASARRSAAAPPPPQADTALVFGSSAPMRHLRELLHQVAPTTSTVLVRGESGTGKEVVARALHGLSARAGGPFVKIDCTSLPENLIESELFGYEKGAFTGASTLKLGRVQLADRGTLFLDEVGELALPLQAKLLRLLQDREFERLGGQQPLRVDVRVVAATHRDLETMVERGAFRQDLFYRLNVVPLWIAPLRARRADIPELAQHFCSLAASSAGKKAMTIEAQALRTLTSQRWPGNVRQLQNFVERLVVLCKGSSISEGDVQAELARPVRFVTETGVTGGDAAGDAADDLSLDGAVRSTEKRLLEQALERAAGNRSTAARLLGVSRSTLYLKLEEHGLL